MVFNTVETHNMKQAQSYPHLACETTQCILWYSSLYTYYIYDSNCNNIFIQLRYTYYTAIVIKSL